MTATASQIREVVMPLAAGGTLFSLVYLKQTGGKDVVEVGVVVTALPPVSPNYEVHVPPFRFRSFSLSD